MIILGDLANLLYLVGQFPEKMKGLIIRLLTLSGGYGTLLVSGSSVRPRVQSIISPKASLRESERPETFLPEPRYATCEIGPMVWRTQPRHMASKCCSSGNSGAGMPARVGCDKNS